MYQLVVYYNDDQIEVKRYAKQITPKFGTCCISKKNNVTEP